MTAEHTMTTPLPNTGLMLIGMGPGRLSGMSLEALNAAKTADVRRYEAYTALWPQAELDALEAEVGAIEKVMRPEVELPETLFEMARTSLVALLVVGDPLQATTHVDLQLQAAEAGLECLVFHGVSITTLVTGAIGLSNYKFGRQTTLTYPYGGWVATSPLEVIAANMHQNLHTLALLDLDPTGEGIGHQLPMKPHDAVVSLRLMWKKLADAIEEMPQETALQSMRVEACEALLRSDLDSMGVVLCSDMGTDDESLVATTVGQLESQSGGRLNSLVFQSKTSEVEEKALLRWR
ncbi:MAG: diphthine synthase [Candidatus Poseidoniaceae archaeon]|nr:diphthine synthase [Candidatus Poseidoniaceae archaeon]